MRGGVPRVPRRAVVEIGPEPAERELDRMGLAHQHRELTQRRADNGAGPLPRFGQAVGGTGIGRQARNTEDVLDRDRQAHQRPGVAAGPDQRVGGFGEALGVIAGPGDVGVVMGAAEAMPLGGAAGELGGRGLAAAQASGELAERRPVEIVGHGQASLSGFRRRTASRDRHPPFVLGRGRAPPRCGPGGPA